MSRLFRFCVRPSSLAVFACVGAALGCSGTQPDSGDGDGNHVITPGNGGTGATSAVGGGFVGAGGGVGSGGFAPAGGGGLGSGGLGTGGNAPVQDGPSHVVIVAHQDDDLLFINPELKHALDRNEKLTTVYVTSGNAGMGMDYVTERELGIRSAYAFMAGGGNTWTCNTATYGGKAVSECIYGGSDDLRIISLRLTDGMGDGSAPEAILKLWNGSISTSTAVDGSGLSFTRAELVATLQDVLYQRGATQIYTTDFTFRNREFDHPDHEYAALFALAASSAFPYPHQLHSHITYSTTNWPANLSAQDSAIVADTFSRYASCDKQIDGCSGGVGCDANTCSTSSELYSSWFSRYYKDSVQAPPMAGALTSPGGCVGAGAQLVGCESALSLSWNANFTLTSPDGQCLTAPALATSKQLSFSPCNGSDHQKWYHLDNGYVVLAAQPAAGDTGGYTLSQCLSTSGGIGQPVRVEDCGWGDQVEWYF